MLIQYPHDLGSVHCAATAKRDDDIRIKQTHLLCTGLGGGQCRIRGNVKERGMLDTKFIQFIGNRPGVPVVIQEAVGNDKGSLLPHHLVKLIQCHRQAALLDIDLFGCAEPQHVLSPLSHGLDVQQMLDPHVLGHGVSAPAATAQRQGWRHLEIVEIADSALG